MLNAILLDARLFLLVFARIFATSRVVPVLSSASIPRLVRILLVFFLSMVVFPLVEWGGQTLPEAFLLYLALLVGEVLIGIAIGFLIVLVIAIFQLAGQFFSIPMGFGAAQVFDPLAQIEIPLLGQFFNLIAIFLFLTIGGLQQIFIHAMARSFSVLKAVDLALINEKLFGFVLYRLSQLFAQALVLAFPIIALLFLVYVVLGLIAKAAPQMNLLILGFPFSIAIAFLIMYFGFAVFADTFRAILEGIPVVLERFYLAVSRGSG